MILAPNPALHNLLDAKKGSLKNKFQCMGEHMVNNQKATVGIAAGVGASAFLGHSLLQAGKKVITRPDYAKMFDTSKGFGKLAAGAMNYYTKAQNKFVNLLKNQKVQNLVGKTDAWLDKITKGGLDKFNNVFKTKGAKTGLLVAAAGTTIALLGGLMKAAYNGGKIDQKYTDKAKMEKDMLAAQRIKNAEMEQSKEIEAFLEKFAEMK